MQLVHFHSNIWHSVIVLIHVKGLNHATLLTSFQSIAHALLLHLFSVSHTFEEIKSYHTWYMMCTDIFFFLVSVSTLFLQEPTLGLKAKEWQVPEKRLRFHSKSDNWHSINLRFALKNTTYQQAVVNTARGYNSSKRGWPLYGSEPEIHFCHKRHPCCSGFTLTPLGR